VTVYMTRLGWRCARCGAYVGLDSLGRHVRIIGGSGLMTNQTNQTMNELILRALGRGPENIQPGETGDGASDQAVAPVNMGSADGGAGTNSRPKLRPHERMNKAIITAWKRRKGRM
jgi:hypothetical protein